MAPVAKQPPTKCAACGYDEPPVFKGVKRSSKQWTGFCAKCGHQHVTGFPGSVISSKKSGG